MSEPDTGSGATVTMANTKAEIVAAALDAGLVGTEQEAEELTKAQLLALWEE